jgi:hypothetical protein
MVKLDSMASDGGDGSGCVVDSVAEEVQTQLGFLAFSVKQCVMDHLGSARSSLCSDISTSRFGGIEHSGRGKN